MATVAELCILALRHHRAGDLAVAEQIYRQILQVEPNHWDAHSNLGAACEGQGKLAEAELHYRHAIKLKPNDATTHYNLGVALERAGKLNDACDSYQEAVRLQPSFLLARNNLGNMLAALGRIDDAIACYRQVLTAKPDYAEVHSNLGSALADVGRLNEAVASHAEALRLRPDFADAHFNLGNAFVRQSKTNEAVTSYENALRINPRLAKAHTNLAHRLTVQGRSEEAEAHLQEAVRLQPTPRNRLLLAMLLPLIYRSHDDLLAWRQRLTDNVRLLKQEGVTIDLSRDSAIENFYSVYQGFNDRQLQSDIASLYSILGDSPPPHDSKHLCEKIRIGFISSFFKDHTIARLMRGLIGQFSRQEFDVTVFSIGRQNDSMSQWFKAHVDFYVELPPKLNAARQLITDQELDVLFYTDIGMEPLTYSLAFSRLASVQCVTWGHPVTTGISTIDYFISSELLEASHADLHYTERLVLLKALAVYYYRPVAPSPLKDRTHFGLPESGALYVCPQSLYKFHPAFDEILAGILRQDRHGTIALLGAQNPHAETVLRQRLADSMPDVVDRVQFVPRQHHADFMNLNALAEVLLDPIHFGGGNTSYEGLALGKPIVTMPSQLLRGRITLALYKQMGMLDCVADSPAEYVKLAVKLGTDADYRAAIREKILAVSDVLFENSTGIRELELFLRDAVAKARG